MTKGKWRCLLLRQLGHFRRHILPELLQRLGAGPRRRWHPQRRFSLRGGHRGCEEEQDPNEGPLER